MWRCKVCPNLRYYSYIIKLMFRIFSLHDNPSAGSNILTGYTGRVGEGNRGKLRSKIESGMGTVPLPERPVLQTWDGVMSGERLLTMSCSDKILSWNVIGVQGSLLSHWLRPVYFSSITIGSRFHPGHVTRALYSRIQDHENMCLPHHYRLNEPPLLTTTSPESRHPSKAHDYSVNWVQGGSAEIVCCATGRTTQGSPSRLCKRVLADKFVKLCSDSNIMFGRPSLRALSTEAIAESSYDEIKNLASDHVSAKRELVERLVSAGCGMWVAKPVDQDQFSMGHVRDIITNNTAAMI